MAIHMTIRGVKYTVANFAEASAIYSRVRDESGEGGSTFMPASIIGAGASYFVSYNGKVWKGGTTAMGNVLVYDPYAPAAPAN